MTACRSSIWTRSRECRAITIRLISHHLRRRSSILDTIDANNNNQDVQQQATASHLCAYIDVL
ncbi:uncharacterized protein Dmoj_GI26834 [Drosophila mojavensis]|nr:uncharacterized protein Dmoj_GI26834 [Drosophila mojavensis]